MAATRTGLCAARAMAAAPVAAAPMSRDRREIFTRRDSTAEADGSPLKGVVLGPLAAWRADRGPGTGLVVSEPRNAGGKPDAAGVANQKDGAGAVGRDRIQRAVDAEIAVRVEGNRRRAVLDERSGGFADERSEDALIGVLADAVAAGEEQAASAHRDPAVDVDVGSKAGDAPGPRAGVDSSHDVQLHIRECAIRVRRAGTIRDRNHADAALESREEVTLVRAHAANHSHCEYQSRCCLQHHYRSFHLES